MASPIPPDRIGDAIRRFFLGLSVPTTAPDATAVASSHPRQTPPPTIGRAVPRGAPVMGGLGGLIMSAGPIGERLLRDPAELTGVPAIVRGLRDTDVGELVQGATLAVPFLGMAGRLARIPRAARAIAPAAAAPATMVMGRPATIADAEMWRNLLETGFAGGKSASMVEVPAVGAGRGGSTATAMAAARRMTTPQELRSMIEAEIARRGGAASPEVEMAATEEVARRLASSATPPPPRSTINPFLQRAARADSVARQAKSIFGNPITNEEAADWAAARNDPAYRGTREYYQDLIDQNRAARQQIARSLTNLRDKYGDTWSTRREAGNVLEVLKSLDAEFRTLEDQMQSAKSYRRVRGTRLGLLARPPVEP